MAFREDHELHKRRFGRNVGLGVVLVVFVVLIFGLTIVKVTNMPGGLIGAANASQEGGN